MLYRNLNSKCDNNNNSRFQQSAHRRAFTLQELQKNFRYIITANALGDQQQVIDGSKKQPGEIQERLKVAKESINKNVSKIKLLPILKCQRI